MYTIDINTRRRLFRNGILIKQYAVAVGKPTDSIPAPEIVINVRMTDEL